MMFQVGDTVRRTTRPGKEMRLGSVWEVVGVDILDGNRIRVPRLGWYAADGFVLEKAAPVKEKEEPKATPHKWAKEIKAWADGAEIEVRAQTGSHEWGPWYCTGSPNWPTASTCEYRIKPEKKPDVILKHRTYIDEDGGASTSSNGTANVQFTFDGETGKLKAVSLINEN